MLRKRIQFFPCSHCSVVFIDCNARRNHYRVKHPKKALPKDFIDFQPSFEIVDKQQFNQQQQNYLEDESESLFEKHFSLSSNYSENKDKDNIKPIYGKKSTVKKSSPKKSSSPSKATKNSSSKDQIQPSSTSSPLLSSSSTKVKAVKQTNKSNTTTNCPTTSLQDMNGSMSNLISIQNVQFVANQAGQGQQSGGDTASAMGTLNQQTKVAFMPISDGSNIVPIAMTGLMNATPLYANIAHHHTGHAQQQPIQFVQVCPQPVQLMDGQNAQAQAGQIIATTGQIATTNTNGKKGRGKKNAAAKATENRVQQIAVQQQTTTKERKIKNNGKRYNCSQCPKYFSTIYNRRRHEEMFHIQAQASNSQQFRCETCDKAFPNLFNLTRHENIHKPITERLRYKCEMVNCKRRFTTLFIFENASQKSS